MIAAYLLIYIPVLLFVVAFLYETWLSIVRLKNPKSSKREYVDATWEITHTVLIFAVVMMLMLFTKSIDQIAEVLFLPAFLAILALMVRGVCYIYLFYIAPKKARRSWIDWLFMVSHLVSALLLVLTVLLFTIFIATHQPEANLQFIPSFVVGLAVILAIIAGPLFYLYAVLRKK